MENTNLKPVIRFPEFTESWQEKSIKNIAKVVGGGTPSTEQKNYWNGEINWFTPTEIKSNSVSESNRKITKLGLEKSSATLLPKGTLLLTSRATIGEVAVAKEKCTTNQGFQSLIVNSDNSNLFIFNLIKVYKNELFKYANGSTFKEISKKDIEKIKVVVPVLKEQKRIADFLTSIETRISSLKEKKDTLLDFKKGVLQKIFNQDIRFKNDNGNDFPDWGEKRVDKLFDVTRGNVLAVPSMRQKRDNIYKYPVYSSQTKDNGLTGYYDEYLFENSITWTTDGANAGEVKFRNGKFYCTNVCGVLISIENANACIAELLNRITHKYVSYVGNPKLMNNIMAGIKTFFPSPEEQIKIANYLTALDDKINALQQKIDASIDFKKGLLQKMFV